MFSRLIIFHYFSFVKCLIRKRKMTHYLTKKYAIALIYFVFLFISLTAACQIQRTLRWFQNIPARRCLGFQVDHRATLFFGVGFFFL